MAEYSINWPPGFENYSWEVESKGWLTGVEILFEGRVLTPVFYDPVRLAQDIDDEVLRSHLFFEPGLIVVACVTQSAIEAAIDKLAKSGELRRLM